MSSSDCDQVISESTVTGQTEVSDTRNDNSFEEKPKIRLTNVPKYLSTTALRKAVAEHLSVPSDLVVCRKGDKWNFALFTFKAAGPLALLGIQEIAN